MSETSSVTKVFLVMAETIDHGSNATVECVHATIEGARACLAQRISMEPKGMYSDSTPWENTGGDHWESKGCYDQTLYIWELHT